MTTPPDLATRTTPKSVLSQSSFPSQKPSCLYRATGKIPPIPLRLEIAFAIALVALAVSTSTVHAVVMVGRNIDIAGETSSDRQRVEPTIAVDPRNLSIIVSGAQDLRLFPQGHRWHGY